jgi:DNA-binding CsgD family transcriptional regulator
MEKTAPTTALVITERQREVAALIAAGCSNEEIGRRLGISARTVKAHADVLRQKLGVERRRQIPVAYRTVTGDDPLARAPAGPPRGPAAPARPPRRGGPRLDFEAEAR